MPPGLAQPLAPQTMMPLVLPPAGLPSLRIAMAERTDASRRSRRRQTGQKMRGSSNHGTLPSGAPASFRSHGFREVGGSQFLVAPFGSLLPPPNEPFGSATKTIRSGPRVVLVRTIGVTLREPFRDDHPFYFSFLLLCSGLFFFRCCRLS
jgi:hypothetical protein